MPTTYSIVAPIFNELDNLAELYRRVNEVMSKLEGTWELILVDDGSTDGSTERILEMAKQDKHIKPVIFARNFGHEAAITAGWDNAVGDAVVIIDADLQDPPEEIPVLIEKWREGYEVVYAVRAEREGETWFKKMTAALFYRIVRRITDVNIPLDTGDFRLMDRKVVDVLKTMREKRRFPRRHVSLGGIQTNRGALQARRPACRGDQVSLQQDGQTGTERHHRVFVFSPANGDLLRICRSRTGDHRHPGGHHHAPGGARRFSRAGDHPYRGAYSWGGCN